LSMPRHIGSEYSFLALEDVNRVQSVSCKIQRKYRVNMYHPSYFHPWSVFGSASRLVKDRRTYRVATYFERVEGPLFLFVPCFYLPTSTYLQSYVAHAYVLNSDEGLTERAQLCNV
jgi:hypothetical protein